MNAAGPLDRLRGLLKQQELDALFVSTPENRRYLSGFDGSAGCLIITQSDAILATDFRYVEQAGRQAPDYRVVRTGVESKWFPTLLSELGVRRVGFEAQDLTVAQYNQLTESLGKGNGVSLVPTQGMAERLRAVKTPEERGLIQRAIDAADTAFSRVVSTMRPGITEQELAWELEKAMRELGAEKMSFDIIVAAGPNGALPHHHPSERVIRTGEPVVIDMGARYQGYCSDMTRTVVLGDGGETFRRVFDTVLAAQETAIAAVEAGMTGEQADSLARRVIQEAGYGDNFGHGLGHGVGLAVHEFPRLGLRSADVLEEGMVFTIEPGVYLSGWGGVRIEDMVVLEGGRAGVLTRAPKKEKAGE
ncbi:MAG: aminopeptidase P family protein [Chloroflexi bacterium]|nr:aminopeptidase P family protein [Chloroflexota bacterium]